MIEIFEEVKRAFEREGDKYFIDKCVLTEGIYVRVRGMSPISDDDILIVKSKKVEDHDFEMYRWFRERDFYSKIIYDDPNKCVESKEKKIHSINPYSLILKRINLPDRIEGFSRTTNKTVSDAGLSKEEIFSAVLHWHFENLQALCDLDIDYKQGESVLRLKASEVIPRLDDLGVKDNVRIKLFMDEPVEKYQEFYLPYITEKAFVKNQFNEVIDGKVMGVPGYNNTLSAKKPYAFMATTSFGAPYRTSVKDAILLYKMSLISAHLKGTSGRLFEVDAMSGDVQNYEIVGREKTGLYKEYSILSVDRFSDIPDGVADTIKTRESIQTEVNAHFFKGLIYSLYRINNSDDVSDFLKSYKSRFTDVGIFNEMVTNRDSLRGYFVENWETSVYPFFSRILPMIMDYEIENEDYPFYKLRKKWDKQVSLLYYFSGGRRYKTMGKTLKKLISDSIDRLRSESVFQIEDDETFYFMTGQIASYLVSKSQAKNKSGRMFSPFLNTRNARKLKDELMSAYDMYSHSLPAHSQIPINKAIQAVMVYTPMRELSDDELKNFLRAGIIGANIFYMKKDSQGEILEESQEDTQEENTEEEVLA